MGNISRIYHEKVKKHRHYDKALHWTKLISVTGSSQILIQALGLITGIIIIRFLPTREYAYYTVANAMLGTMTLLADGGISSGVMAAGGRVWLDKTKLGVILVTGLNLRRKFAIASLLFTLPVLYYLLNKQGAHWWEISFIILALIPSFLAALSDSLLQIIPKLHQDVVPLQKNQLYVSIIRAVLSIGSAILFPFTSVALIANGIPRIYGNIKLKKIAHKFADFDVEPDAAVKKDIMSVVYRMMPEAIYYSLSGQITIWFLSFFGNVDSLAQIGALGRISILASLFTIVFGTLIMPRFARLINERKLIFLKYTQTIFICIICLVLMNAAIWVLSDKILLILGKAYTGLDVQLSLLFLSSTIGILGGVNYSLFTSRGWVMNPVFSISINVISLASCAYFIDVSTLNGAITFGLANNLIQLTVNVVFFIYSAFNKTKI